MIFEEKHIDSGKLGEAISGWKAAGQKVALAVGCFDMLHVGCVRFLSDAAERADRLVVGVLDDDGVRKTRGDGRPVMRHAHRMDMVAAIEGVDAVTGMPLSGMTERLAALAPDFIIVGADHPEVSKAVPDNVKSEGRLIVTEMVSNICSDWLVRQIKAQVAREKKEKET